MMLRYLGGVFWQKHLKIREGQISVEKYAFLMEKKHVHHSIVFCKTCKEWLGQANQHGSFKKLAAFGLYVLTGKCCRRNAGSRKKISLIVFTFLGYQTKSQITLLQNSEKKMSKHSKGKKKIFS